LRNKSNPRNDEDNDGSKSKWILKQTHEKEISTKNQSLTALKRLAKMMNIRFNK
jgi:hypothetical protein